MFGAKTPRAVVQRRGVGGSCCLRSALVSRAARFSVCLMAATRDAPDSGDPTHEPEPVADDPTLPAAAGSTVFVCPAEAGQVDHAQLWYYLDHSGVEQGPFSMMSMRAWYEAGYFEGGVTVAASHFGEVPLQHWQIAELWEVPLSQAFVPAAGVETIVEAPVADPEFIPCAEFAGGHCCTYMASTALLHDTHLRCVCVCVCAGARFGYFR